MLGPWSVTTLIITLGGAIYAYTRASKAPLAKAAMAILMVGWMYTPHGFFLDLPVLPPLFPESFIAVGLVAGLLFRRFALFRRARALSGLMVLWLLFGASRAATALTNRDPLVWGPKMILAMSPFDALTGMGADMAEVIVPLAIGVVVFRTRKGAVQALTAMAVVALPYVLLILYELKMAPVLQRIVFGYRPPSLFSQSIRDGGYRPQVFFSHGLSLGIAWLVILLAIATLYRLRRPRIGRFPTRIVLAVFACLLVLIKAKAALAMGLVAIPMVLWSKPKRLVQSGLFVAIITFAYPALHLTETFPHEQILGYLAPFGQDRIESMEFRFDNEAIMAERAAERLWFGWGGYGRDRIYDTRTGRTLVIQDGHWIITLGLRGVFGYVIYYGTLCWPLVLAWRRFDRLRDKRDQLLVGSFSMMLTVLVFNSIPNMALLVMPYVLAGAILGLVSNLPHEHRKAKLREREAARQAAGQAAPTTRRLPGDIPQPGGGGDDGTRDEGVAARVSTR